MPKFKVESDEKSGQWIQLTNKKGEHLQISINENGSLSVEKYNHKNIVVCNSAHGNLETFLN